MFDIGFWEIFLIGIIALFVVGPERLPDLARRAGLYYGRLRRFVTSVKADIDREMGAGNLQELKEVTDQLKQAKQELQSAGQKVIEATPNRKLDDALINGGSNEPEPANEAESVKQPEPVAEEQQDITRSHSEPSVTSAK